MKKLIPLLVACTSLAAHAEVAPPCPHSAVPADWTTVERGAFRMALPPGATFTKPGLSIDYESGTWGYDDGRSVSYQFGFDVDSLEIPAGDRGTTRCSFAIGRHAATLLRWKNGAGDHAFGVHVPGLATFYPGTGELVDGLTVAGAGADASMHDAALAITQSLRLSRLPAAATGVYETPGLIAQGLSVHVAGQLAGLLWGTYDAESGAQLWLSGEGRRADVYYRPEALDAKAWPYEVPVTFYRSATGSFPARPGATPFVSIWGRGTIRFSDDCAKAELAFRNEIGTLAGSVPMIRLSEMEGDCSRFAP